MDYLTLTSATKYGDYINNSYKKIYGKELEKNNKNLRHAVGGDSYCCLVFLEFSRRRLGMVHFSHCFYRRQSVELVFERRKEGLRFAYSGNRPECLVVVKEEVCLILVLGQITEKPLLEKRGFLIGAKYFHRIVVIALI
ncbi:MAG: hypothetical protein QG620_634 [Patescibacteria group bacterium]|nr:hypothetical protein [Patescibacteria group bacterium]